MIISAIAALSKNKVIGRNNDLPWKLPDDMKYFMETTRGHHVVMGRRNYDSLRGRFKPLPERVNVVITRQKDFLADRCVVVHSMEDAIDVARRAKERECFIIGGAEIYKLSLPYVTRLYLTEIDAVVDGDTYFPEIDLRDWKEVKRQHHPADDRHQYAFDFVLYEKPR